ncbi:transcription-repair coupling factor [Nesterenkonia alkaliphila]|uniref:Transcription-repair-coupling factor n=1 Tax=Nesterenkonia alkaliphila TaxID=1463631 RepID=A0A7K1UEE7_9MICC|nr:transcription-repair coupling factor [Nesterenkonia alkaliphila]MVT24853.1 transcription-repair coupling factor [Nesterenkonia alkaliphila]GFZ92785.1 transcription-repair-coupling factor [Nesterenkonia alkaliphila]
MSLKGLRTALSAASSYSRVVSAAGHPAAERTEELQIAATSGLRAALIAEVAEGLRKNHSAAVVLAVTATDREADELESALSCFAPEAKVGHFPSWETLPHERLSPRSDTVGRRLGILRQLAHPESTGGLDVVVAPIRAVIQPIVAGLGDLQPVTLTAGEFYAFDEVVASLAAAAYSRVDMVTRRGEFAVRGGILDVFPPNDTHPVRVEFFGDEVEQLRHFSVADQLSIESEDAPTTVHAVPCRELLITDQIAVRAKDLMSSMPHAVDMLEKISQHQAVEGMESLTPVLVERMVPFVSELPEGSLTVVVEPEKVRARAHDLAATNEEFLAAAWQASSDGASAPIDITAQEQSSLESGAFASLTETREASLAHGAGWWSITSLGLDEELEQDSDLVSIDSREPIGYRGSVEQVMEFLAGRAKDQWSVVVTTGGSGSAARVAELLAEHSVPHRQAETLEAAPPPGQITVTTANLAEGFAVDALQLALLTESEMLGRSIRQDSRAGKKRATRRKKNPVDPLSLTKGDFVVHEQHGIGQFVELIQRPVGSPQAIRAGTAGMREYMVLEYASSKRGAPKDRLMVPTDQLDQVSQYVGGDVPALSKMGGSDWAATKRKARRAVKEIAAELIRLYAARMASRGHAFSADTPWQAELEDAFPYVETPDQLSAMEEVKRDMEAEVPMDRLISGDVGFGKTEIAIRAAFKAVQDGKQVAVLVPTTLLVSQHYETFTERYAGFPVRVRALSRFQTGKESKEVMNGLKEGAVDIVIGTHRLLGKEVQFKDLGLVIIDEEQRFGVEHKEQLKKLRTNVDVLAMTATPIPRTLEMSLAGIRETSELNTPPEERHPVLTYVGPYTDKQVSAAIRRELMREGQVFYVHNRVADIDKVAARVRELVPEARVEVAHGQMGESQLERIVQDFWERRFDVLVSTTIIETGLDISNANTLLVDRASAFGLSQLHQLRGRVGRSRERAYAYFLYPAEKPLGEDALERLKAVAAHNELGAGFQLAKKDLQLRGAGNLLGGEQSGHIEGVGFDLYLRMVGEAVADYRGEEDAHPEEVKIELPINAHLPADYVPSEPLRLEGYRKLAAADTEEKVDAVVAEWTDRYGELPQPAQNLVEVSRFRNRMRAVGITDVGAQGKFIRFSPVEELAESRQLRMERMFSGQHKTSLKQVLLAKPTTAPVGGEDLTDGALLDWLHQVYEALFKAQ